VDVVVAPDPENLKRVAEVAVAIHGHIQTGESFLSTPPSIAAQLASGERVAIETELGQLDVVQGLDGVSSYDKLVPGQPRQRFSASESSFARLRT
jgi:hypothetical protein